MQCTAIFLIDSLSAVLKVKILEIQLNYNDELVNKYCSCKQNFIHAKATYLWWLYVHRYIEYLEYLITINIELHIFQSNKITFETSNGVSTKKKMTAPYNHFRKNPEQEADPPLQPSKVSFLESL